MKIKCEHCGHVFQFETINESWTLGGDEANIHVLNCSNCKGEIIIKTILPMPEFVKGK